MVGLLFSALEISTVPTSQGGQGAYSMMLLNVDSGPRLPGFESQLCPVGCAILGNLLNFCVSTAVRWG